LTTDLYTKTTWKKDGYSEEKPLYERIGGYNGYSKIQLTQILNTGETGYIEEPIKEPGKMSRRKIIDEILRRKMKILDTYQTNYDKEIGVHFGDYHKIPMSDLGSGKDRINEDGYDSEDEFNAWSRFDKKERGKNLKWKRVSPKGTNLTIYRNGDYIIAREINAMYQPWKFGTVEQYLQNDMKLAVHGNISYLKRDFEDWVFENQGELPQERGGRGGSWQPQNKKFTPYVKEAWRESEMAKVIGFDNLQQKVAGMNAFANIGYQKWDNFRTQDEAKRTGPAFVFEQALPQDVLGLDKRGNPILPKRVKQNEFGSIVSTEVINIANPAYSQDLLGNYGSLFVNRPAKGFNQTKNGFYFMDMYDEKGKPLENQYRVADQNKRINFNINDFQFKRTYGNGKGQKITYKSRSAGDGLVIWKDKELAKLSAKNARDDGWLIRTVRVANGFVNLGAKRKHYPSWHPLFTKENKEFLESRGVPWLKNSNKKSVKKVKTRNSKGVDVDRYEYKTDISDELLPGATINKRNFPSGKPTYYRKKKR